MPHPRKNEAGERDKRYALEIKARLAQLAANAGSGNKLADIIGRSRSGVRKWLNTDVSSLPNAIDLRMLVEKMNVRAQWLLFGVGPMKSADENFVVEFDNEKQIFFYSRDYVRSVVLAVNNAVPVGGAITAVRHADIVTGMLEQFQGFGKVRDDALKTIVDRIEGRPMEINSK